MSFPGGRPRAIGRLGAYAPVPFVGAAAILVALIIFTPVLLASGPSPLAVRPELVIYRVTGAPTVLYYLHGVDPTVPYGRLLLGVASFGSWTGACPTTGLSWSNESADNVLELGAEGSTGPTLIYAYAVYNTTAGSTIYAGAFALVVDHLGQSDEGLSLVPCAGATPGVTVPSSWSTANLPLPLLLVDFGTAGPPGGPP